MEIGTGVFLGSLVIALVILFAVTKDRWRWRRIIAWAAALTVLPGGAILSWMLYQDRLSSQEIAQPKVQSEFWGLRVGMPTADVLFKKGKPLDHELKTLKGIWAYQSGGHLYLVTIVNDKVQSVIAEGLGSKVSIPTIQGIGSYSSQDDIERKFGLPDHTFTSKDGLRRRLNYKRFNLLFDLERDRVDALGIIDGAGEPVGFGGQDTGGEAESRKK